MEPHEPHEAEAPLLFCALLLLVCVVVGVRRCRLGGKADWR